jgi:hypothetical protein
MSQSLTADMSQEEVEIKTAIEQMLDEVKRRP